VSVSVEILSGLTPKAPAAIVLNLADRRFLLDAGACIGYGNICWQFPADIDGVFISHDHVDHIGGYTQIPKHVPVYCSEFVASRLSVHKNVRVLPVQGRSEIMGIRVSTGAAGHALGGIWFHFDIGGGVFYSGDYSLESGLYRFDVPPPAELALLDMSYGNYDISMSQQKKQLDKAIKLTDSELSLLLPVPASGRSIELAIWLSHQYPSKVCIDRNGVDYIYKAISRKDMALQPEITALLVSISQTVRVVGGPEDIRPGDIILAGSPDLDGGLATHLIDSLSEEQLRVIFTGHLGPLVREVQKQRETSFIRWNVHPTLSDNIRLIRHLRSKTLIPLFHPDLSTIQPGPFDCNIFTDCNWKPSYVTY
jgi:Cft2 family RNA processing exonuclease